jgi:uncharacterized protein YndB with AHSA1/START domain
MVNSTQNSFVKDFANGKIVVTHYCDADNDTVWDMWTKPDLLDLWWAPKPWKSETKSMSFTNGGRRLYAMAGPDGTKMWAYADFRGIAPKKSFEFTDGFSDQNGVANTEMPATDWKITFDKSGDGVKVTIMLLAPGEQLQKLAEMGFEEGFKMALGNLDEELAKKG